MCRRALCLAFLVFGLRSLVWAEALRFAPLPMESREVVEAQFRPMVDALAQALATDIAIVFVADYEELLEQLRHGRLDLAYLGPLPYVRLREAYPAAEPLVIFREASGEPQHTCALVAALGEVPRLAGLQDRRIALSQPLSTCGMLVTDALLRRHGTLLSHHTVFYAGTHAEAVLAVARGDAHLAGVKTAIARKFEKLGLEVRAESEPLPGFTLVANAATLAPPLRHAIIQFLLAADQPLRQGGLAWGEKVGFGVVPAHDRDFDPVRHLLQQASPRVEGW